jgi:hypothetical protein
MEKQGDGRAVFRNAEMEERVRRQHEEKRQVAMEKICSQLQAQMEKEEEIGTLKGLSLIPIPNDRPPHTPIVIILSKILILYATMVDGCLKHVSRI